MKICFFDSGMGGLAVLAETQKLLPNADYLYFADCLSCPLGNKSEDEIVGSMHRAINFFVSFGKPDAIVIACNTATGYGIGRLRNDLPDIPFFGVEPAIKPAAAHFSDGDILTLVTNATSGQDRFKRLLTAHNERGNINVVALSRFASVIESNFPHNFPAIKSEIIDSILPFITPSTKAIVLGCTHYTLVKNLIESHTKIPNIFDGNTGVANRIFSTLTRENATTPPVPNSARGSIKIYNSAHDNAITKKYLKILKNMLQ